MMESGRICRVVGDISYIVRSFRIQTKQTKVWMRCIATTTPHRAETRHQKPSRVASVGNASVRKADNISQAMKSYLERAKAHDAFMEHETAEYEIGKRHLAAIMGQDPDTFTQQDIDQAIEYLLPSGLYDKKARPVMKHPTDVIPNRKAAQFGMDGRPFHFLFYTGQAHYYQLLHDAAAKLEALKEMEDRILQTGEQVDRSQQLIIAGSEWIAKHTLEEKLQELLSDNNYLRFIRMLERLALNPCSSHEKDFIMEYRRVLTSQTLLLDVPELKYDEDNRPYMEAEGERIRAKARVKVLGNGTGKFTVNGDSILHRFPELIDRQQLLFPLQFTDLLGSVDVEAHTEVGGRSTRAGAIRLALSRALQSFVSAETVDKMRLAGLLTKDPRMRERQKPGQAGARKKYTWKKR